VTEVGVVAKPIDMPFGMWTHVLDGSRSLMRRGNLRKKWPAKDMPRHVQWSIYTSDSKRLSMGQHR